MERRGFIGDAEPAEVAKLKTIQRKKKSEDDLLALVPPLPLEIFRPSLIEQARKNGIGENKARRLVAILIENGALEVVKKPRSGTKAAEFLRRKE
jgi:hypothetical protein